MLADPAVLPDADGTLTLFAEYLDYRTNVGEIRSGEVKPGADGARAELAPLLSLPVHMSYPFPFRDEAGRPLMTAETWQAGEAILWARQDGAWQRVGTLFPGRPVVDPTIWRGPDRWWLFCGFQDDSPNARLYLFHAARLGDAWTPHPANPVRQDRSASRGAGPIFEAGTLLIRLAQDCSVTYGGAVTLNAIRHISPTRFVEEPIRRIAPEPGPYPHGLHTFCPAGRITFVDGKRLRVDPGGISNRLHARFPRRANRP